MNDPIWLPYVALIHVTFGSWIAFTTRITA